MFESWPSQPRDFKNSVHGAQHKVQELGFVDPLSVYYGDHRGGAITRELNSPSYPEIAENLLKALLNQTQPNTSACSFNTFSQRKLIGYLISDCRLNDADNCHTEYDPLLTLETRASKCKSQLERIVKLMTPSWRCTDTLGIRRKQFL